MNSYLGLVSEYAKVHKKKNRLTVVCIAISVMLVMAVFGMADMSVRTQINENIRQKGNWHAIITGISDSTAVQIGSRKDVNVSGWVGVTDDTTYRGKDLFVQGSEQAISEEMNLVVTEGTYPSSAQEALLDMPALKQFGLSVGDTVEITFSDGKARQYVITGAYDDFSSLKGRDAHGLFLSLDGVRAVIGGNQQEYYYIQFNSGVNINRALSAIKVEYALSDEQVSVNTMLLGLMGQSADSSMTQLYLTAVTLAVLVAIAGMFMIASSFNMSILERTQFFGLLRCLGATKKQVKRYVRLEGLRYSLIGIPIGLLTGCCVVWLAVLCLNALDSQYLPEMPSMQISWLGLLTGAVVGFVTVMLASRSPAKKAAAVSPQSAVTGNINCTNNLRVGRASNTKLFRVDTAMGINHAFSNKKSMTLITGSFAISIILFLCFTLLITFMNHALRPLQPYSPDISIMGADHSVLLNRSLMEEIKKLPGVNKVYGRMFLYDIPATAPQKDGITTLISYDEPQFDWAEKALVSGSSDNVQNGNGVFIAYSDDLNWNVGDTITLNIYGKMVEVQVAGILSSTPFVAADNEWLMICSESTFTGLIGITDYTIIDMQVDTDVSGQVRSLLTPEMQMLDKQQSNSETRTAYNAMAVFVYGFLIVIALVALINILNTVNASVSNRMNNYGVMRAVGMSCKQLRKMITAEAVAYAITGSIVGSVLGLLLHRYFFGLMITSNWGENWQPPAAVLAIAILAALFTTLVAVILPAKKIEEMSIVNVVNAG